METRSVSCEQILDRARAFGASLVGLVPLSALQEPAAPFTRRWPCPIQRISLLVLALEHPESEPELDWWDAEGGTEGNCRLIALSERMQHWLSKTFSRAARPLPYHPWKGGVLLKDAAVLAGLGCIGDNNLLITPQYGTHVRLRALLIDLETAPVQRPEYNPCAGCPHPCWKACPQQAFASGTYQKAPCARQMELDEANAAARTQADDAPALVSYCRACELACPAGR
jgi:epoxyqueuosine reductase